MWKLNINKPILYSFRRCPYAMRARMALLVSGVKVALREVVLKDKPTELHAISPKATVPVLLVGETVIDESIDIMHWALKQSDPDNWLPSLDEAQTLIQHNDHTFKHWLDRYKYADRHPEHTEQYYRQQGEVTLNILEEKLQRQNYLCANHATFADIATFPFIRQFAGVDNNWFATAPYPKVRHWLNSLISSELFQTTMHKYPPWRPDEAVSFFPSE